MYGIGTTGRTVVNLIETKAKTGCSKLRDHNLNLREITYESLNKSVAKQLLEKKEMLRQMREEAVQTEEALRLYVFA
ncbi:MAG TPA: hypothetical protein DDW90_01705 [Cyanobacteria bacterium UBA9971]|nr:hypothetical protein [Cyanobacteria bacterium UBA9971]